jgi:hypothetical protein
MSCAKDVSEGRYRMLFFLEKKGNFRGHNTQVQTSKCNLQPTSNGGKGTNTAIDMRMHTLSPATDTE